MLPVRSRLVLPALILLAALAAISGCGRGEEAETGTETTSATEGFYAFDTPPVLKTYPAPEYPEAARRAGLEGRVDVKVLVETDGSVVESSVLSATDEIFIDAAVAAIEKALFDPALKDGKPTRARVMVPVEFALH